MFAFSYYSDLNSEHIFIKLLYFHFVAEILCDIISENVNYSYIPAKEEYKKIN